MNSSADLLNQLHDIYQPAAVPFWPPAPGWWIITVLLLSVIGWGLRHYYRSQVFKRIALQELKQVHENYQRHNNQSQLAMELSNLLRRVALVKYPHRPVSNLIRFAWLQFLDDTGKTQAFTEGPGQVLCTAPYQKSSQLDAEALLEVVKQWIKRQ